VDYDDDRVPEKEGVRLIGADEAAEALERDDTVQRRRGDQPRFGDRPTAPESSDPRPTIRFPLASDAGPQAPGAGSPVAAPRSAGDELPHWTDPPTGDVPRIFAAEDLGGDDDSSWTGFSSGQPRWRGEGPDRNEDFDDFSRLADDETRLGALASEDRPDPDDFFAFGDDDEPWADEGGAAGSEDDWYDDEEDAYGAPTRAGTRTISSDPRRAMRNGGGGNGPGGAGRDVRAAVGVGVGFAVVALAAFYAGGRFTVALIAAVLAVAATELLNVLRQAGYQPAILLGVAATAALPLAAYYKGEAGIPVALFLAVVFGLIWYLVGAGGEDRPVIGLSSTLLAVCWIGVLGSFAALMLVLGVTKDGVGSPGIGVLLVAILGTVGYDIGGFVVGRNAGTRPLSPASPNKTVEGLIGGVLVAVLVTVVASSTIAPFSKAGFAAWLLLGVAIAIAAPLGDLCQSMIKRDLDVKDMGTILPGHGGFLDRFDALLFVLPVVYFLARVLLY